jgi:hypothetical protein
MRWDKPGERECVHAQQVYREESLLVMHRVPPPLVPVLHMMTCVLSHARDPGNECLQHLAHAWSMRDPKPLEGTPNYSEVACLDVTWCHGLPLWPFSLTEINPVKTTWFVAVFLHENNS